jgi:hypothetical protein
MEKRSKLKPINWFKITSLTVIASVLAISVFAITDSIVSEEERSTLYGLIWLVFGGINLSIWIIRKDLVSLIFIFITLTFAISYLNDYKGVYITIPMLLLFTAYGYIIFLNHKLSKNYRKLLELAAKPVESIEDGFSARPYPGGTMNYDRGELKDFARFLMKEFIAIPYVDKGSAMFMISEHPRFWLTRPDERRNSYVHFSSQGHISVNMIRKEYKKYDAEYTFDDLCQSLASLFRRMFEYHRKGRKDAIRKLFSD